MGVFSGQADRQADDDGDAQGGIVPALLVKYTHLKCTDIEPSSVQLLIDYHMKL